MLFLMVLLSVVVILLLNAVGLTITKNLSALFRNVVSVLSTFLVWIVSIIIGWETIKLGSLF